jgi:uncharacterized protein (DUF169 family)
MTPLYSDVFKLPSEISDHDAAVAFLEYPKSTSCSIHANAPSTKHTHKTKDLMHCQKIKLVRSTSVLFIQRNLQQCDLQSFYKRK